jgi:hypothetical protein
MWYYSNMDIDNNSLQLVSSSEDIKNKIYTIRGVQVMLDSDLAELYQVETKRINESVKRNPKRFPEKYCFSLTDEEYNSICLKSQIATSNGRGGRRSSVKAFTEHAVAMLSSVLSSDIAINVSLRIMDAFVEMRHYLTDNALVFNRLDRIELKQIETDKRVDLIFKRLEEPREKKAVLFFKGQMYDAFSCIADIISKAKSDIILIDGYVDTGTLDLLSKKKKAVSVEIYTSTSGCKLTQKEIADFNSQYGKLTVKYTTDFHDRFMILDKTTLYHIGASIKDAGKKAFEISIIDDAKQTQEILNRL